MNHPGQFSFGTTFINWSIFIRPQHASPAVGQLDTGELLARYEAMVIEQEKASQYSGDDKVVRCRMGLPPQKLQEWSEQALWKAMLKKANGDDRTAFSWMLEMYCSR